MSDRPPSRPAPYRPAPVRTVVAQRHHGRSIGDLLLVIAGVLVLVGVGYVAYRMEVLGEPLDEVLPFLAEKKPEIADPGEDSGAAKPTESGGVRRGKPVTNPDGSESDTTYFGRKERHRAPDPGQTR